jgi:hypothetical protein
MSPNILGLSSVLVEAVAGLAGSSSAHAKSAPSSISTAAKGIEGASYLLLWRRVLRIWLTLWRTIILTLLRWRSATVIAL